MDKQAKKEIQAQYKEREMVGAVYGIRNTQNGKLFVDVSTDLRGMRNRFEFSVQSGACVQKKLEADWKAQHGKGFLFEVLEELRSDNTQSTTAFKEELLLLKELWLERLTDEELY